MDHAAGCCPQAALAALSLALASGAASAGDPSPMLWARTGRVFSSTTGVVPGESVAISRDFVAVASGTHAGWGVVSVFPRLSRGTVGSPWEIVRPSSTFGKALAIGGGQLIVTAPGGTTPRPMGSAMVYELRQGQEPRLRQSLIDLDASPSAPGDSILLFGDELFLGATAAGSVARWTRASDGTWSYSGKVLPGSGTGSTLKFGASMASDGSILAIGAPSQQTTGRVHVYGRDANGGWAFAQLLAPPDTAVTAEFGWSVAVRDGMIAVGAPRAASAPSGGTGNTGAVYIFGRNAADTWVLDGRVGPTQVPSARAGASVRFKGSTLLVTAPAALSAQGVFRGTCYSFDRTSIGWQPGPSWAWPAVPPSGSIGTLPAAAMMGAGAALDDSGDDLIVTPGLLFDVSPLACATSTRDSDGDGVADCADDDVDGDGVPDALDQCPFDASSTIPGPCGCGNPATDSDGDGMPDCTDPSDDGDTDVSDACRTNQSLQTPDACGCDGLASTPPSSACTVPQVGPGVLAPIGRLEASMPSGIDDLAADGRHVAFRCSPVASATPPGWPPMGAMTAILERRTDGTFAVEQVLPFDPGFGPMELEGDVLLAGSRLYRRIAYGNWRASASFPMEVESHSADIDAGRVLLNGGWPRVYEPQSSGSWSYSALPVPGTAIYGGVELRGNEAWVGSPSTENAVHCFRKTSSWQRVQTILPPFPIAGVGGSPYFGVSLAVDGDWLFVGADAANVGPTGYSHGIVFVYRRTGTGPWTFAQAIVQEPWYVNAHFGSRIVARDGLLLVPYWHAMAGGYASAAMYRLNEAGTWEPSGTIHSPVSSASCPYWGNVAIGDGFLALDGQSGSGDTCLATAVRFFNLGTDDFNQDGTPDPDADGDGTCDAYDRCPGAPDVDSDRDGFLDCLDPTPSSADGRDIDLDGVPSPADGCPNDPLKVFPGACGCGSPETDTDGDGQADCVDADDDNDGVPDSEDPCDTLAPSDVDGDGIEDCVDLDDDGDGVTDTRDLCPGLPDADTDGNGVADCLELPIIPAIITPDDGVAGDGFGTGLALDGSLLAVGEPGRQRVSLFARGDQGWAAAGSLHPSAPTSGFGTAVAASGDMVVIGGANALEVHVRSAGTGWTRAVRVLASDLGLPALVGLGTSVAAGPGYFVAAAPSATSGGLPGAGSAVFGRIGPGGAVSGITRIESPAPTSSGPGQFGLALAANGQRIAMSAAVSPVVLGGDGLVATYWVGATGAPVLEGLVHQFAPSASPAESLPNVLRSFGRAVMLDHRGGLLAHPCVGFERHASGQWRQVMFVPPETISGSLVPPIVPWIASSIRGADADRQFTALASTIGSSLRSTVRIDRIHAPGRSSLDGFVATGPLGNATASDTVAVSGGLVAAGSPGLMPDGSVGPGFVAIYDLCTAGPGSGDDCDSNGRDDACEIGSGAPDADDDGVLDRCERARGDLDLDGDVDGADLSVLLGSWGPGPSDYDLDGDDVVNGADLAKVLAGWAPAP